MFGQTLNVLTISFAQKAKFSILNALKISRQSDFKTNVGNSDVTL